jgi:hypothetical protein
MEWPDVMMELQLTLDFHCRSCEQTVGVTVKCSGKGLVGASDQATATVNVPCPHCGQVNQLSFDPSGAVRAVRPFVTLWPAPGPSVN